MMRTLKLPFLVIKVLLDVYANFALNDFHNSVSSIDPLFSRLRLFKHELERDNT